MEHVSPERTRRMSNSSFTKQKPASCKTWRNGTDFKVVLVAVIRVQRRPGGGVTFACKIATGQQNGGPETTRSASSSTSDKFRAVCWKAFSSNWGPGATDTQRTGTDMKLNCTSSLYLWLYAKQESDMPHCPQSRTSNASLTPLMWPLQPWLCGRLQVRGRGDESPVA
ncbi:hypothetical protein MHYP_G00343410 [Metynnis hypsauchen]